MADERKLFDKPMTEFREAFVRARFAQEDVFGRPDIEQWLAGQRKAERPEYRQSSTSGGGDESHWNRVLVRDLFGTTRPEHVLRSHASPYRGPLDPRRTNKFGGSWASIAPLMSVIMNVSMDPDSEPFSSVGVYYGHRFGGVIVVHRIGTRFSRGADFLYAVGVSGEPSSDAGHPIIQPFERSPIRANNHVLDVLFAEWLYERERKDSARQFLCDALAEEITRERAKAETDFDTAVAVSADGTKIVHADWVVVVPVTEDNRDLFSPMCVRSLSVWPASTFTGEKIRRSNHMLRSEFPKPGEMWGFNSPGEVPTHESAVKAGYSVARRETHEFVHQWQIYCEMRLPSGIQRLLFTAPNFCPSPLPDGGVEVTV